jgi:DNA-binding transcriptional LysR family regulator
MADKKRTDTDWESIRVFLALARHGSQSAAARALGVNHATIARRLRSLEATLGKKLFERRPEGYVLTSAGTLALEAASKMENSALSFGRGDAPDAPSGLVRINAPPALATGYLVARLSKLGRHHAALDLDLATDLRHVSLERHEADIAIRMGRPTDGDVIAKPLVKIAYAFYGTKEFSRKLKAGADPIFIGFNEADNYLPEAAWLARHFPRARVAFRAGDQFAQAIAARSGVGIALLPRYIGSADPLLSACILEPVPPERELYIVTRSRDRHDQSIRAVAEGIELIFRQDQTLFS